MKRLIAFLSALVLAGGMAAAQTGADVPPSSHTNNACPANFSLSNSIPHSAPGSIPPPAEHQLTQPVDARTAIAQFQAGRAKLIAELNGASDAQRADALRQLQTLREHLTSELANLRSQELQNIQDLQDKECGRIRSGARRR